MRIRLRRLSFLYGCSEALKTTRRNKRAALHVGVGSSVVFWSDRRAFKDANSQFSQHLNTQTAAPLVCFVKFVAGLAPKCPVKEKCWSREGSFGPKKTMGTHIPRPDMSTSVFWSTPSTDVRPKSEHLTNGKIGPTLGSGRVAMLGHKMYTSVFVDSVHQSEAKKAEDLTTFKPRSAKHNVQP